MEKVYCLLTERTGENAGELSVKQYKTKSMVDLTLEVRICQSCWWAA